MKTMNKIRNILENANVITFHSHSTIEGRKIFERFTLECHTEKGKDESKVKDVHTFEFTASKGLNAKQSKMISANMQYAMLDGWNENKNRFENYVKDSKRKAIDIKEFEKDFKGCAGLLSAFHHNANFKGYGFWTYYKK